VLKELKVLKEDKVL